MPITTLIYNSRPIRSGTFPTMWKLANVILIHKQGATDNKGKYRPISVLSALSKILEIHVHDSLYAYPMARHLLHVSQSGFRTQHYCDTALNYMVHKWALAIDKGFVNGVVLFDLRKAFDLVNHNVLLEKMAIYGCSQQSMQWFILVRAPAVCPIQGQTLTPSSNPNRGSSRFHIRPTHIHHVHERYAPER